MNKQKRRKKSHNKNSSFPLPVVLIIGIIIAAAMGINSIVSILGFILVVIVGIGFLVVYAMYTGTRTAEVEHYNFDVPRNNAKEAAIELRMPPGEHDVRGLANPDTLLDARISHLGPVTLNDRGDRSREITLQPDTDRGGGWTSWLNPANWKDIDSEELKWAVRLNTEIKTMLKINTSMGDTDLDLRDMNLALLDIRCGAGDVDVFLPGVPQGYDAAIKMSMGELDVKIYEACPLNLTVQGSAGECTISIPRDADVRLKASMGMGNLNVSDRLELVSSSGKTGTGNAGVWETPGFEESDNPIVINFKGNMGDFKLV